MTRPLYWEMLGYRGPVKAEFECSNKSESVSALPTLEGFPTLDEEVLRQLSNNEYLEVKKTYEEITKIFHRDVASRINPCWQPSSSEASERRAVTIDGVITDGTETRLWSTGLEILYKYLDIFLADIEEHRSAFDWPSILLKNGPQLFVEIPLLSLAGISWIQKYDALSYEQDLRMQAQSFGIVNSMSQAGDGFSRPVNSDTKELIEWALPQCSEYEKTILQWMLSELNEAEQKNVDLSMYDQVWPTLLPLAASLGISAEALGKLNGRVVDSVVSESKAAPTIVVFLDNHVNLDGNLSNLHDLRLLQPTPDIVALEGVSMSEKPNPELLAQLYELLADVDVKVEGVDSQIKIKIQSDPTSADLSNKIEAFYALAFVMRGHKPVAPSFKQQLLIAVFKHLENDNEQLTAFEMGCALLYTDLNCVGIEPTYGAVYDPIFASSPLLNDFYQLNYRSQFALDHLVEKMKANGKPLGVLLFGESHYDSLWEQALARGDVNVLFVYPQPYHGAIPK